ncbi:MAG: Uma2 family endonuclease [Thiolinea sp.]
MAAPKLKTFDDLLLGLQLDERIELINGELVPRASPRFEHGVVQAGLVDETSTFRRRKGPGGWWIATEVSVRYSEHHCPTHDLAGWRKERVPERPGGIMTLIPDWVCEITSPGHERRMYSPICCACRRNQVPYYWVISPEDRTLIAYAWSEGHYHVVFSVECDEGVSCQGLAIPPFAEQVMDLDYVFGLE